MGTLDLTGANTKGFDAIKSGRYPAVVYEAEVTETKGGPDAKLPMGTPMLKVQFQVHASQVIEGESDNRRAFGNYPIAWPSDYDADKVARMKGNLVNLLLALGYEEKEVNSAKFNLDADELVGRECDVILGQQPDRDDPTSTVNTLKGVKPKSGEYTQESGGLL